MNICVFCGSSSGKEPVYLDAARTLGREIARRGWGIVYGGAHVGLMGAVADEALAAHGNVAGVIPKGLVDRELAHAGLTSIHVVNTMHERKAMMADLADAFVAMPGGYGTLDEFFEILTWAQLGIHRKPCAMLNTRGFFDPLLKYLDGAVEAGFLKPAHRELFLVETEPAALLERLPGFSPTVTHKWMEPAGR